MRFERVGNVLGQELYAARISGYTFCISFDKELNIFGASWKNTNYQGKQTANWIGENKHPVSRLPYFDNLIDAERACAQTLKQLRQKQ